MIIDTHAHIYSPDDGAFPPGDEPYRPPAGAGSPDHLRREMRSAGVDLALLIQTFTFYRWDNAFIRATSTGAQSWCAGVVNLDPANPHSPDVLYAMVSRSNVKAIRVASAPYGRYDLPGIHNLYKEARDLGIAVNALIPLEHADELSVLLDRFPDLPVVLDHCLSLAAGPLFEPSVKKVIELARHPNLHAKLTFLPTGSAEEYPFRDMQGACKRFIEAYGAKRCVWGSDFPTELWCPKVSYGEHLRLFQEELGLSASERDDILGLTAQRLYFSKRS